MLPLHEVQCLMHINHTCLTFSLLEYEHTRIWCKSTGVLSQMRSLNIG